MSRRRGTGGMEQVGTRWRFHCPDGAGGRYRSPVEYDSDTDALRGLAIYRQKIVDGELTPARGITLRQYVENTWLPRIEKARPRSHKTYRSNWRSQISKAPFVDRPLSALRRRDVRAWVDSMDLDHPEHPAGVLKTILAAAVDDELIEVNPAASLRLERKHRDDTCPTPEEERAILTCAAIPYSDRLLLAFAAWTALRPGEWRNLQLQDLRLDGAEPHVYVCRGSDDGPTKSGKPRKVPLFGLALAVLREWLRQLPEYAPKNPLGLVFPHASGARRDKSRPLGGDGRESVWHEYRELAGVTRPIRLHDWRHRGATALLTGERGRQWTLREVQGLVGHASFATTEGTYAHDLPVVVSRAAAEHRSVQDGPDEIAKALFSANNPQSYKLSHSSAANPPNSPETPVKPENGRGWTVRGPKRSRTRLSRGSRAAIPPRAWGERIRRRDS